MTQPRLSSGPVAVVALLAALAWPAVAAACPVCFNMREASRLAFVWTAVLLSLLPLSLIGGVIYWIWRQVRAQAERDSATRQV